MILIGLGANLPSRRFGAPRQTLEAALSVLQERGVHIEQRSPWYTSLPVPRSDQPRYVNGVVAVATALAPGPLLALLHEIEREFGRQRTVANAARVIDLDLLAYDDVIREETPPILPHPRLTARAFVLRPLCDIAPQWRHPKSGLSARQLLDSVVNDGDVQPLDAGFA